MAKAAQCQSFSGTRVYGQIRGPKSVSDMAQFNVENGTIPGHRVQNFDDDPLEEPETPFSRNDKQGMTESENLAQGVSVRLGAKI